MSYPVLVPLHVAIVAVPDAAGVHWKTRSGALPLSAHVPASVLAPLVVPLNVPPAAGITVAFAHAPVCGVGVGEGALAFGGVTVRLKSPWLDAYPSTTMK